MNLSDIFCQDKAVSSLQRAFGAGKIPHAQIFAGADGIGKFTTAKCWAKLLLCASPVKKNDFFVSCDKCPSCIAFEAEAHPDFHHIYKELLKFSKDAKNRERTPIDLPIDVVREFVLEKISNKPTLSASKVFIINEAEKLNTASQNALLKVLEEPPGKSFIILLCTKLDNLLPTTKSRCRTVNFASLSEEKIIELLSQTGIDKNQAKFLARFTAGSIGRASLLAKLEPSFYDTKKQLIKRLADFQAAETVDFAQWISSSSAELIKSWEEMLADTSKSDIARQARKVFVQLIISALNDAMKFDLTGADEMTNFDQPQCIRKLAQKFDPQDCARAIEACFRTSRFIDSSVNEKLIFEHLLLNLINSDIIQV
jgi:DNA polymerase-3 subunit delta'